MDNQRKYILILLLVPLIVFWTPILNSIYKQLGYDVTPPKIVENTSTTSPSTQESSLTTMPTTTPGMASTISSAVTAGMRAAPASQPSTAAQFGSKTFKDVTYRLGVSLNGRGGALDSVVLNEFKQNATDPLLYTFQEPYPDAAHENAIRQDTRALATRKVTINGNSIDISSAVWDVEEQGPSGATLGLTIVGDDGSPLLRMRKKFEISPKTDTTNLGYELLVTQSFQNLSQNALKVSTDFNGANMPPAELERSGDRQTLVGYSGKSGIIVTHDAIEGFTDKAPSHDYTKDKESNPFVWTGASSTYFNAIVRPLPIGDPKSPVGYIQQVTATAINPAEKVHEIIFNFSTAAQEIAPGSSLDLPLRVYLGPRQREVLNSTYYSTFPVNFDQTLVLTTGICGACTFQWLINVLVGLLAIFHSIFRDWGLAIIGLVVLVRALLHPITKRSQISMSRMSKMGPEMERLKLKYKDQPDELNKAMMQFYKEQGVAPVLGCLPMFLQMPIWLALWQSLQTTFELRQAPFLQFFGINFTWIHDLSKPDHLIALSQPFDIFFLHVSGLNLLPVLLGVVFFIQQKMQPKPANETPEQEQQRKMMQWMSLLFPVMLYAGPSGLNLYILTSTAIGIVESKIVRDHLKQQEEAEKAGRVIVDPGTKFRGSTTTASVTRRGETDKPAKGLMKWLADLQQKADQMRQDADKKKKK